MNWAYSVVGLRSHLRMAPTDVPRRRPGRIEIFHFHFVRHERYISMTLPLRRTTAPPRRLFWVLGCWVVVWVKGPVKADYFPGAGGVGSLRLRPLFVPSIAIPLRPPRLFWIKSIYRPLALPSLSPSIPADDEAYELIHGGASSASPSTSLRPKRHSADYS